VRADELRTLFDYSYAANLRVLNAAARLTPDQFSAPPPLQGASDLRQLLTHTLDTEQGWRELLCAGSTDATPELDPADFADSAALAVAWDADEERMRAWLATLDDAALDAPAYKDRPLWQWLMHMLFHSAQHRAEAAMLLTHWGASPDDLDFAYYLKGWSDA
jgi:uncharacterized damage-inducible protein DinB